jgi:hypothetical protein
MKDYVEVEDCVEVCWLIFDSVKEHNIMARLQRGP